MFALDAAEVTAYQQPVIDARNFLWISPKHRDTGDPVPTGFWSDGGSFDCEVKDGLTASVVERSFLGAGLVSVSDIMRTSDISIRRVEIVLSAIDDNVQTIFRTYECRQAPFQLYRGLLTPGTFNMVAPAKPRFVGYVDEAPVVTSAEGGASKVTLRCVSQTVEFTRKNPEVRSHESQIARAPGDMFYKDMNVVGDREVPWGEQRKYPKRPDGGNAGIIGASG